MAVTRRGGVLYQNDGDVTFADVTSTAGVRDTSSSVGTAWAVYDGDGAAQRGRDL